MELLPREVRGGVTILLMKFCIFVGINKDDGRESVGQTEGAGGVCEI